MTWTVLRKIVVSAVGLAVLLPAGAGFYRSRRLKEPVVLSAGVTEIRKLGDYFGELRGTANDCNIFFLRGKEPGGTVVVAGGTHPEEPAGRLAAWLFAENGRIERGTLIVVLSANRSATTVTRPGAAYPDSFAIPTPAGERRFRMGDRWSNPLDQWPDP